MFFRTCSNQFMYGFIFLLFSVAASCSNCSVETEEAPKELIASFTFSPMSPVTGQALHFRDTSTGNPTSWQWDFGDGSTSILRNPSHFYTIAGSYLVTLVAINIAGSNTVKCTINITQRSTILPPDRTIDWSGAGVWHNSANPSRPWEGTKEIPDFPVGITVSTTPSGAYYCDPTGTIDCRANLQAAINACPKGYAVYIPAGTYSLSPTLRLANRVVLRGAGPGVTTLKMLSSGNVRTIVCSASIATPESLWLDSTQGPDSSYLSGPVISGYTKDSYTITVSSALAANLNVGCLVMINQLNDTRFVTNVGYGGTLTWGPGRGERSLAETKMVAAVNGTSVTFTRPLYYTYESEFLPKLTLLTTAPILNAGIENLTIDGDYDGGHGGGRIIDVMHAAHCWFRGLEFKDWELHAIRLFWGSLGCEVTKCYMHDPGIFTADGGYQVNMAGAATDNYAYDNISKWVHIGICVGGATATGNVIAYNYNHSTNHHQPYWTQVSHGSHGAHTYMNLFEGNVTVRQGADSYWGTGSHLTMFRNWHRLETNSPTAIRDMIAIDIEAGNQYTSAIGNVLGHSGMIGSYEIQGPENGVYDSGDGQQFCWKIGFPRDGDQRGTREAATINSLIRHGNYDYINNAVVDWIDGLSRDLPPSLYLDAKPAWFGSLDWPAFGPDVPGYVKNTPSKLRWDTYAISGRLSDLF